MTKIRVLLAEAHQPLRAALRHLMESRPGIEVVGEAATAEEVFRAVSSHKPDIVLVDVTIPGLDGFDTSRRLRTELPDVKVIVIGDEDSDEYRRAAQSSGASAYLVKARVEKELPAVVRSLLR